MKRQLPQWMLGVPSSNLVNAIDSSRNSCDKDIDDGRLEREPKVLKKRKQSSRKSCDKDIEDERMEREPKVLKKRKQSSHNNSGNDIDSGRAEGERKGLKNRGDRRAKLEEKAIECENKETVEPIDSVKGKQPRSLLVKCSETKQTSKNASSYAEMSKNKKNSGKAMEHIIIKNGEDVASTYSLDNEDNEDLTLEDLMVIANEFIQEDDNSNQVDLSKDDMSVNKSQGIVDSHSSLVVPPVGSRLIEAKDCNSTVDQSSTENSFKPNLSVNPTQSLMDIFLGPLPKNTQEEVKKVESMIDKWDLEFEAYKQKSVMAKEKPVTTTLGKKKSSLKEKVMMFLD